MSIKDQTWSAALGIAQKPAVKRRAQQAVQALADKTNYHVVRGMADGTQRHAVDSTFEASPWMITTDYVRHGTLHLVCQEVRERGVEGALGEVGVFRGDFAILMERHLPGRPVHLFDTFEGFDERDVAQDEDLVEHFHDFSPTDPESVRARLPASADVHLHVGYFPESAAGFPDDVRFAVASIDADLYAPVLSSLDWFYDRLSPGGYILVHDFNNEAFGGAKKAVREFQDRTGASIVPIPDWGGTAVVTRSRT